ncbi:MAG: hypothetical protein Q9P44_03240 [Anaerolineae bacterium]|nr:hypothetical protein [Anaerolineae bacterium]
MDTTDTISILILAAIAIVGGYFAARAANTREPVHGGGVAKVGNYAASAILVALAPTVLCTLFFIRPTFLGTEIQLPVLGWNVTEFAHAIIVALMLVVLALVFLIPYALAEKPHLDRLAQQEDAGWTREDAETSGL